MSKNYAVIDIGTLKVKLLIATPLASGELKEIYFSNNLTCFGCGMDENDGNITQGNLEETIKELLCCKQTIEEFGAIKTRVVSTHALRRAKNQKEITQKIELSTGLKVENISQDEEALLFFKAVMSGFLDEKKEYAVVDVGGGSVQILLGNKNQLRAVHRMQTGAQYLHENFTEKPHIAGSFTTEKDLEKMRRYILEQSVALHKDLRAPIVYGSSCIIDLMKATDIPLLPHPDSKTHPYQTYAKALDDFIERVLPLNYGQREAKYPFQDGYMWGIDKAFLNIVTIARQLQSPYIIPSNANIAQGIVYAMFDNFKEGSDKVSYNFNVS